MKHDSTLDFLLTLIPSKSDYLAASLQSGTATSINELLSTKVLAGQCLPMYLRS
jgi:hypothetical protein